MPRHFNNKELSLFLVEKQITMWRNLIFNCVTSFVIILSPGSRVSIFIIVLNLASHPDGFLCLFILGCGYDSYVNVYRSCQVSGYF